LSISPRGALAASATKLAAISAASGSPACSRAARMRVFVYRGEVFY
jgi:hypothetical protein